MAGGSHLQSAPGLGDNGPHDDYPIVLGDPYTIDGITYTPEDVMNYDAVGFAVSDEAQGPGVVAAHRTLPLPSYVEVTSLETGRTILVRLTTRGPMHGDALIGLSPGAADGLGIAGQPSSAVRVRRVNPPETERALLRAGEPVPPRMDTPVALLAALKRKLVNGGAASPGKALPATANLAASTVDPDIAAKPVGPTHDAPETPPPPVPAKGAFVQIGAFSSEANARKAASGVDAVVSKAGKLWVARMGPFAGKAEIDAALAKARAAGYGDAMVRHLP